MKKIDEVPGRTKKLIPMVAEALGDKCTLYADANGSYLSVQKAIEVGKILEANGVAFYEEPVPFDYLEETKQVANALSIPIAWGEHPRASSSCSTGEMRRPYMVALMLVLPLGPAYERVGL